MTSKLFPCRLFLCLIGMAGCVSSAFSQQTKILTGERHNEYGLVYSLPVTALEVEVVAEKQTLKTGPFYQYAKRFAGTSDVVKEDEVVWTIKDINLRPFGIADSEQRYLMQLKAGATTFIAVAEDGMLLAINANPAPQPVEETMIIEETGIKLADNEYLQYMDEDFTAAISSFKKAQLLSDELAEIRDAKISLTRGTAETMPTDGKQLEIMLNSLARQEAALMAAFTGTRESETIVRKFSFIPEEEGRWLLFRMSGTAGPLNPDSPSGEPVYINVKILSEGEIPLDAKGEEKKVPKDAVAYCVPGEANIKIASKEKTFIEKNIEVAQFGFIFGLNPSVFTDKKEPSYAIFDPVTGALRELGTVK